MAFNCPIHISTLYKPYILIKENFIVFQAENRMPLSHKKRPGMTYFGLRHTFLNILIDSFFNISRLIMTYFSHVQWIKV